MSELAAGEHYFNFNQVIPPHSPGSFESKMGHIRHFIKVTLKLPTFKFDIKAFAPYTVIALYDLNQDPGANVRDNFYQIFLFINKKFHFCQYFSMK